MTPLLLAGLLTLTIAQAAPITPPSIIDRPTPVFSQPEEATATEDPDANPVDAAIAAMTLQQRVAQLMVVTMAGSHHPSAEDLAYLKAYTPGAVIVRKILKPSYAAVYVTKLRGVEQLSGVPLWIGANIYRLTTAERQDLNQFIQLPTPLSLAAANDPETTHALAELLAQHMSLMGFNLHLGPSLELAATIEGAEGSVYNFGSDPAFIGETFQITRRVFQEHGILTVPVGFPGGGANRKDKSPAVLLTPRSVLPEQDLAPYRQAIADGAPIIHVGSTLVPTLDPSGAPACVSEVVLRDMLRGELGYEGIIMAGPVDSQDFSGRIDSADAAIRALEFGADMIMWSNAHGKEMRAVDRIVAAVLDKRLSESTINNALRRVLAYKFEHRVEQVALKASGVASLENNKQLAQKVMSIEQKSITVVQNVGNILPLREGKSMPVGITGTIGVDILHNGLEKHFKPISRQQISTARHLGEIQDFEIDRITSHIRGLRTVVCIFGETDRPQGQVKLVLALKEKGVQVVVVLLGYPKNLPYFGAADGVVLAYCDSNKYEATLASMADILAGEASVGFIRIDQETVVPVGASRTFNVMDFVRVPAGRLPVTLSERFSVGLTTPYDPSFTIKKVLWDFGDGKKSKDLTSVHAFKTAGRYPVSLSVTTQGGDTSHCTFHVVADGVQ